MHKTQEQILKEYEEKSEAILQKMMRVFLSAQRQMDDEAYRKALGKIENLKRKKETNNG